LTALLGSDGRLLLSANGRAAAETKAEGLHLKQPKDGLQVGRDENGAVGDYKAPFAFGGTVLRVVLELQTFEKETTH
jgi:arylsulfatase